HCDERDGPSKANRNGKESRHESERGMINPRQKMIFTSGTRQCSAQFAITERAAKRGDSANDPKHEQCKSRLNFHHLETDAREDSRANDVRNNDGARREETHGPGRGW